MQRSLTALILALGLATGASAQAQGMGPGKMDGHGPDTGCGMGQGMGHGRMGGPGGAPGMGHGMGHGMGPGMGQGMMGGPGGAAGMAHGMMWGGYAGDALASLALSAEQRQQVQEIQGEAARSRWQQMKAMQEQRQQMMGGFGPGLVDEAAARKAFDAMQSAQKSMLELSLSARKRIEAVLTPQQREQLARDWGKR